MMVDVYVGLILFVIFLLPFLAAAGFGVGQAVLVKKGLPFPLILPGFTGGAVLFFAHQVSLASDNPWGYVAVSRLAELFWSIPLSWSVLALAGTLVGWAVGACRGIRQRRVQHG